MTKNRVFSSICMVVLAISLWAAPTPVQAAAAPCTCVNYIRQAFGNLAALGNAYLVGPKLLTYGFVQVAGPQPGAIAVMQPGFPGADKTFGHVAIVESSTLVGNTMHLSLRGAAQKTGGTQFAEFGCPNVRVTVWPTYNITVSGSKIKFYMPRNIVMQSAAQPDQYLTIQGGSGASGAYIIGQPKTGKSDQLFTQIKTGTHIFRIVSRKTGMCLVPRSTNLDSKIVQKPCTGSLIENWKFESNAIQNMQTGYRMKIAADSIIPGLWWTTDSNVDNLLDQTWIVQAK